MNLMEGILDELNRCRELKKDYEEIGTVGTFGAAFIQQSIDSAEKTIKNDDIIGMLKAYNMLKEHC